jgi:hypothetical protein
VKLSKSLEIEIIKFKELNHLARLSLKLAGLGCAEKPFRKFSLYDLKYSDSFLILSYD